MRLARVRVLPGLRLPALCCSALPADLVVAGDEPAALRRFLVARKWDVDKAQEQLQRTLDWRANEFGVAAFLARWQCASAGWATHFSPAGQASSEAPGRRALTAAGKPAPGLLQGRLACDAA